MKNTTCKEQGMAEVTPYKPLQKTLTIPKTLLLTTFNGDRKAATKFIHQCFIKALQDANDKNNRQTVLPIE